MSTLIGKKIWFLFILQALECHPLRKALSDLTIERKRSPNPLPSIVLFPSEHLP